MSTLCILLSAAVIARGATPLAAQATPGGDPVPTIQVDGLHLADSTSWSIEGTPFVTIGSLDGAEPYLFGDVESVALLPGGRILVADGQALELRVFDLQGRHIRTVGRPGDGPGEFRGIDGVRRMGGDSLAVFADGYNLVHIFDPSLEFVRRSRVHLLEQSAEPPLTSDMLEGVFASGDPFFGDYITICRTGDGEICSDSVRFSRTDIEGRVLARFGTFEWERGRMLDSNSGPASAMRWPLPQPLWTVGAEHFYFFDQDRREIRVFDFDGAPLRRVVIGGTAPDWTRGELFPPPPSGAWEAVPPELRVGLQRGRSQLQAAPLPKPFPTFADMLVSERGWLWLREYLPPEPDEPRPPRWYVFDPDGRLRYRLISPPGMIRQWRQSGSPPAPQIYDDMVLGVVTDEFGVERVVGYHISKGGDA